MGKFYARKPAALIRIEMAEQREPCNEPFFFVLIRENVVGLARVLLLTKQSKIVYHDKSYSFETDFGRLIRFNGKKKHLKQNILFY